MLTSKRSLPALLLALGGVASTWGLAGRAEAQLQPAGPPGGQVGGEEEKEEGIAEKAPEDTTTEPTVMNLPPYPGEKVKAFQLLTFDGYFRLRTDWMKNFNLGYRDFGSGTPFPTALSCRDGTNAADTTCGGTLASANMRLRLEPTVHLSEQVSIHVQMDVLDNVVLGSTSEGVFYDGTQGPASTPVDAFSDSQAAPESGRNALSDSIVVKRAWGEVVTPIGLLKFGRMPTHFGLGLRENQGGGLDEDHGDTVDRVQLSRDIPGTPFLAAIAIDWTGMGPTSAQETTNRQPGDGQPFDLENSDDTTQYVFTISQMDDPDSWKKKIDDGVAFNWGIRFTYRTQDWQIRDAGDVSPSPTLSQQFHRRGASLYIPDAYARVGGKKWILEAELVSTLGSIDHVSDVDGDPATEGVQGPAGSIDVQSLGAVVRASVQALDELRLGFELGYASGDDWDATKQGEVDYHQVPVIPRSDIDGTASAFLFDPSYQIDLILFRQLLGTVRNATYVRPSMTWDIMPKLQLRAWAVVSFANKPIATPGNGSIWGVELDADLGYHNDDEGFFAGISYGFLIPLSAMDHTADLFPNLDEQGDASNAQTIRMRFALTF